MALQRDRALQIMQAGNLLNDDPLTHLRTSVSWDIDTDGLRVRVVPNVAYSSVITAVELTESDASSETLLWGHQVKALEHFVAVLQLALDRTREALERRRQQERAL